MRRNQIGLGELHQLLGVSSSIKAMPNDEVITDFFGCRFQAINQPPKQWLEKEDRQSGTLNQIPKCVAAAKVSQFMGKRFLQRQAVFNFGWQ